ncbi:MAG: hypothetical protein RIA65_17700, partial [Woeseia sp.]
TTVFICVVVCQQERVSSSGPALHGTEHTGSAAVFLRSNGYNVAPRECVVKNHHTETHDIFDLLIDGADECCRGTM